MENKPWHVLHSTVLFVSRAIISLVCRGGKNLSSKLAAQFTHPPSIIARGETDRQTERERERERYATHTHTHTRPSTTLPATKFKNMIISSTHVHMTGQRSLSRFSQVHCTYVHTYLTMGRGRAKGKKRITRYNTPLHVESKSPPPQANFKTNAASCCLSGWFYCFGV
jgi:hypothetical protein